MAALGALIGEALIAATVRISGPKQADFNQHRWVFLSPWGRLGLWLGAGTVIAIAALSWRASRGVAPWRRAALVGLRGAAAVGAMVVFLEPAIELRLVAHEPNRIAVLIDDSKSMSLAEVPGGETRIDRVRRLLSASEPTLATWQADHRVDFYTFSDTLRATSLDSLSTGQALGKATMIRKALELVREHYEGHDLAGIVLISDGAATGFDDDAGDGAMRDFLRALDTRVHTVWAARDGLKDVAVARVVADEFAFVRTVLRIEAVIHTTGLGARRVPVTLSTDGQTLRRKMIDLGAGDRDIKVTFEVTPPRVGRYVYEVSVPAVAGEAVTTNNSRSFVVRVIRDKIRVLQISGAPSWDVRALRQMLKSNPNVDVISFFILRTQDDVSLVPQDEMSLIPFPTQELFEQQLPSFDVIFLQNFEFRPYGIGDYLEDIRRFVEGGGGLVMLGGAQSYTSGGYYRTPIEAALPVELLPPTDSVPILDTSRFQPQLTAAGAVHPVTSLRFAAADNLAAWRTLPPLEGANLVATAKPDATVLATHPRLKTNNGKPMPVIIAGDYGNGRAVAFTTDSLWRYGFVAAARPGDDGRRYAKLWESSIRWLVQDPDLRNLQVDSDAVEYAPEAPVRIIVRLLGLDYRPVANGEVSLVLTRGADPKRAKAVSTRNISVGETGTHTVDLGELSPGIYRVSGRATIGGRRVEANDIFLVRGDETELDRPVGDRNALDTIASATDGQALGPVIQLPPHLAFDAPRSVRVDRRTDVELWSHPALLVLVVGLLGLEWLLRQRSGYL